MSQTQYNEDEFNKLQHKLVSMWKDIGSNVDAQEAKKRTIVVVPSLSVDIDFPSSAQRAYEERMLFMLFLLQKTNIGMIFITSQPIQEKIINYYLEILPGIVSNNARKRLYLVTPEDSSSLPLTRKILNRPHLIAHIRSLIGDLNQAHMVPFNTTDTERDLAVRLGIPMYAADPRFFAFGTKSGCRQIFAEENIQHPLGYENLFSIEDVTDAIRKIRAQRTNVEQVVVKLNDGVSGLGNSLVNLNKLPEPGSSGEAGAILERLQRMKFEGGGTFEGYMTQLVVGGAITEEFITGVEVRSPSAQLRVAPTGEVEMLSTHDQILGGASGQSYLGAIFPADTAYSGKIMRDSVKIGNRLAKEGIIGRFALDFVVVKKTKGNWETFAIEVNLRKGGTTAPYLILQYLTDGHYDAENGIFKTANGTPKYYVASDHIESESYRAFSVQHLFDIVSKHRLHYNHTSQTGVIVTETEG